jgi:hypothetical protein
VWERSQSLPRVPKSPMGNSQASQTGIRHLWDRAGHTGFVCCAWHHDQFPYEPGPLCRETALVEGGGGQCDHLGEAGVTMGPMGHLPLHHRKPLGKRFMRSPLPHGPLGSGMGVGGLDSMTSADTGQAVKPAVHGHCQACSRAGQRLVPGVSSTEGPCGCWT